MTYATSSPAATTAGPGNSPPSCQNCTTSTTPLWRRDEIGSVLCNACGLFLKLHGRPRPISLKTDVIKSRNRVKSSSQGPRKKSLFDANGLSASRSDGGTPPPGSLEHHHRRTSQKTSSGTSNGSNSPLSRTATPAFSSHGATHPHGAPSGAVFDGVALSDHGFHHSPSLPALHLSQHHSPGASSTMSYTGGNGNGNGAGDRHLEPPPTWESLHATNTSLKTRVSELEVINDLYQSRVSQLEQEASSRRGGESAPARESSPSEPARLRSALEETQRREQELKRRLEDLERELSDLRRHSPGSGHRAKKMRLSDIVDDGHATPMSTSTPTPPPTAAAAVAPPPPAVAISSA